MKDQREPNQHIWDYLDYYLGLDHSPGYAVMIRGPWGIGKTHLIKAMLDRKYPDGKGFIYVSLYGVADAKEIDNAILASTYPILGTKAAKLTGGILATAASYFRVEPKISLTDIVNQTTNAAYVFDDIERAAMNSDAVFGYINTFVEHAGCRVILVANEAELQKSEGYTAKREKLVGQTLEAQSEVAGAFDTFLADIKSKDVRDFLVSAKAHIIALYDEGKVSNLRVLKQTLWDFERFCSALDERHLQHPAAMLQMVRLLFAISFEIKLGRLQPEDIRGRRDRWLASAKAKDENSPIKESFDRYSSTHLGDTTLSDELLVGLLVHGVINEEVIKRDLNASAWFLEPAEEPSWRTLWHYLERDEGDVERAVDSLQTEISEFEYRRPGEILHVFGIMLRISDSGLIDIDRHTVVAKAKRYITSLRKRGDLPPLGPDSWRDDLRYGSWGGLAFSEANTPEYGEIYAFLADERAKAKLDRLPKLADQLMMELQTDPDLFCRRLVSYGGEQSDLIDGPVLKEIAPDRLLRVLLDRPASTQLQVFQCLLSRYRHGGFSNGLEAERAWVKELYDRMLLLAKKADPIRREKLTTFARWIEGYVKDDEG